MFRKLAVIAFLLLLPILTVAQTVTPAPELINFQGRLAKPDGTSVTDGTYSLRFSLWSALSGGTEKWNQTMNPVLVKNGTFSVLLGNGNPITADMMNSDTYLEIKVGTNAPLSPRQRIASVAYALKANTVPDGAITTNKLADGAITATKLSAGIGASIGGVPAGFLIMGYTPIAPAGYTYTGETINNTTSWNTQTPLPQPNAGRSVVVTVNGKIYYLGGSNGSGGTGTTDNNFIYEPVSGTWTTGANMPGPRQNAGGAVVNGKIHIVGGAAPSGTPYASHFVYDPATNSWATKAPLPIAKSQISAVGYRNSLYVFGGSASYVYDDISDTWNTRQPMLTARNQFALVVVGQRIYAVGGWVVSTVLSSAEVYDIASNTWLSIAPMPTASAGVVAAVVNDKIFVFGGTLAINSGTPTAFAMFVEYDPLLNAWTTRPPSPTTRAASGAVAFNNSIYVLGGQNGTTTYATNEVYTPGKVYYVHQKN